MKFEYNFSSLREARGEVELTISTFQNEGARRSLRVRELFGHILVGAVFVLTFSSYRRRVNRKSLNLETCEILLNSKENIFNF